MPYSQIDDLELTLRLPALVRKLSQCLTMTQEVISRRFDLTVAEASLLASMDPGRKLCSTALMERQELSKGRISRIVESLHRKGFVIKNEHHDDRRHNILELTDRGRSVRQAITEEQGAHCRKVLAHVPDAKRAAILPALEQLVEALERTKHEGAEAQVA